MKSTTGTDSAATALVASASLSRAIIAKRATFDVRGDEAFAGGGSLDAARPIPLGVGPA